MEGISKKYITHDDSWGLCAFWRHEIWCSLTAWCPGIHSQTPHCTWNTKPHHISSHYIISHHIISHSVTSYHIKSHIITSHIITSYHNIIYHIMTLYNTIKCHIIQHSRYSIKKKGKGKIIHQSKWQ